MELIDRLRSWAKQYDKQWEDDYAKGFRAGVVATVDAAEELETEPMRYGKWVLLRSGDWTSVYGCSVCKRRVTVGCDKDKALDRVKKLYPYCHCGAKMDLED